MKYIYPIDAKILEFNTQFSVIIGIGCLGYFSDFDAKRFLINAHGYVKDLILRESVITSIYPDYPLDNEVIDYPQNYKIRHLQKYLNWFKELGFAIIQQHDLVHPDNEDTDEHTEKFCDLVYFHLKPIVPE